MSAMAVAAKRYAKALFSVASGKGTVQETSDQLDAVASALNGNPEILAFLAHPNIGIGEKARALRQALAGKVSEDVLNALLLLLERGRSSAIADVSSAYRAIADEALGRATAKVTSAYELTAEEQQHIAREFSALTGKSVTVETVVDASLLGGIRVRIGDTLYDGSLATKLAEIERSFNHAR